MLSFEKLTLDDVDRIKPYFAYSTGMICDHTVGGTFMWRDYFSKEYAIFNDTMIQKAYTKYYDWITAFTVPLGKDPAGCIQALKEYCASFELPVIFCAATKDDIRFLSLHFKKAQCHRDANWSDYIYRAEDLVYLPGRKYHGQKNHINYFKKTVENYRFEEITGHNINEVKTFYLEINSLSGKESELLIEERSKVAEVLERYQDYGLLGGLLRADGRVVAFSVGEIAGNVLYAHIEKADLRCRGAYQMISNEFVRHYAANGVAYVNRGEDEGEAGLRASKQSYHPCGLIDKYVVMVR